MTQIDRTALAQAQADVQDTLAEIDAYEIRTTADADFLRGVADKALKIKNQFEDQRKEATQPINQSLRTINGWFKPITEGYDLIRRRISAKLVQAQKEADEAREAALRRVAELGGHVDETTIVPAHHSPQVSLPKGVGRKRAVVTVTDPANVPRIYCVPDPGLVKAEAEAALKEGRSYTCPPGFALSWKESGT